MEDEEVPIVPVLPQRAFDKRAQAVDALRISMSLVVEFVPLNGTPSCCNETQCF